MEALVSPCSKGAPRRCWTGGDASYSGATRGRGAPPMWAGRRLHHVAAIGIGGRGLAGFSPIFLPRRAVIPPPALPPPPPSCYASSHFSALTTDTPELQEEAEVKMTQDQMQTRSGSRKVVAETEAALFQTQMASELPKVAAETEDAQLQTQIPSQSLTADPESEITQVLTQVVIVSLEADAETESTKDQTQTLNESRTVRVKFKLEESCQFGEQFLLVGEDDTIGLWDPASATPLEWSDGHVWTAEVDLPVGKQIKFKFILRQISGEIKWQPGPDRILQTWETTNTIVVQYGWENAEDQKITEDRSLPIPAEGEASRQCKIGVDAATVVDQIVTNDAKHQNNPKTAGEKHDAYRGDPALVAGLAPMPASPTETTSREEADWLVDGTSVASGEGDGKIPEGELCDKLDGAQHEVADEQEAVSSPDGQLEESGSQGGASEVKNEGEAVYSPGGQLEETDDSQRAARQGSEEETDAAEPAGNALENGIHWGRQAFHKFIMTLGLFQQGST